MRLYHFSENPTIELFVPRPVQTPVARPAGTEWLNGPLVWAITEERSYLYLFPRDCPRILLWATDRTSASDRERWIGETTSAIVAYVEEAWFKRLDLATIYRYELPTETFENLHDAGMWVSKSSIRPFAVHAVSSLPLRLGDLGVELRIVEQLTHLRDVWGSTVQASGIRLRNANGWGDSGWPHSTQSG